jgi:hypothetical protein
VAAPDRDHAKTPFGSGRTVGLNPGWHGLVGSFTSHVHNMPVPDGQHIAVDLMNSLHIFE